MVGPSPSAAWNQQVAAHRNNTDQKEKLELEILKQASLREFEDDEFLRRLRYLRGSVGGERWQYMELLRSTLEFARVVVKPKNNVDMREIILKTDDRLFHISRDLLKQLTFTELEVIEKKVKCVYQEDELLKNLLKEEMDAALPEVYMKPQGITYNISNGVGYFRVPENLKPSNKSLIMHLHQEIRRKGKLNEDEQEMLHILQNYIASLSNLKGDEKKAPIQKKDKDGDEEDKKEGKKRRKPEEKKGGDKKDPDSGKERTTQSRRGVSSRQQTRKSNCDISTISQGSKPRVEITSTDPIKSIQMVSETVLQPLTPKLKIQRKSPIRTVFKVTANGVIRRRMEKIVKVKPKLENCVPVNTCSRINFKHSGRKPEKKELSLVPCTTGLSITPLAEEAVVDKQWLQNKKAWMIKSVEEDGEDLKIMLISGDIKMLKWNVNTDLFSILELRRILSLLGKTTPSEKSWREKLANFIIYKEERKLKKKELSKKLNEERLSKLKEKEKGEYKSKCRILKNPDRIEYEMNGRKVFLRLEYLLYSSISRLEYVIEILKYSDILEELEAMEKCKEALEELKSRNVHK